MMRTTRTRRKDPPTASQLARERHLESRAPVREQILSKLGRLAASMVASTPPPPPRVPRPPAPPPPPSHATGPAVDAKTSPAMRKAIMQAQANVAAGSAPCLLTAEQLASSMPSEWTLRCWRRAQEKFEAEEQKAQKPDQLSQLRFDPITHKLVAS
jgi:hypothetical protein